MDRAYIGPRPYGPEQADIGRFFGRDSDAVILAEWWRDNRLTFAVGPSGRGKTSLLNAGVLPRLAHHEPPVLAVGRLSRGVTFPVAALPPHNPYTLALLRSWSPGESSTRLAGLTVHQFLAQRTDDGPLLAAIDPLDELLAETAPRHRHRQRFLYELAAALESLPRLHLLLVGREESVALAASVLGNGARYEVPRLTESEATEATSRPFSAAGGRMDDDCPPKLISDLLSSRVTNGPRSAHYVRDDGVEPSLLQIACSFLENSLPAGSERVTAKDVNRYGDVNAALTAHLRTVLFDIADDHGISASRLRSWLAAAFVTEFGTREKVREGAAAKDDIPHSVVAELEDRQVLVSVPRSGPREYELLSSRLVQPLSTLTDTPAPARTFPDRLRLAEHALSMGELDLAQRYADGLTQDPDFRLRAQAHSLLGNLAVERDKLKEAGEYYREAMECFETVSDGPAVAYQLAAVGQTLLARGEATAAAESLRGAVARMPGDVVIRITHAHALWQLGTARAAVAELTVALTIDGGNVAARAARGEILADLGEARDALLDLDRVTAQDQPNIHAARGLALAMLGDHRAARRETDLAFSDARQHGPALLYMARAAALDGDDLTAADLARQAVAAIDPPLSPSQHTAAQRLKDRGPRQPLR